MTLHIKLFVILIVLLPAIAYAELPEQFKADLAPLSGHIIMPIGDEFLVDLDAASNLQEGDILTLIKPGETVIHPISKEILGSLDIPTGYLQVTRIKSGYSYAKLLQAETAPQKADKVRRFEQVPTKFESTQATDDNVLQQLKTELPQFNWLDSASTTTPVLVFSLNNNTLSIKDAAGTQIRSYQIADGQIVAHQRPVLSANTAAGFTADQKQKPLQKAVNNLLGVFSSTSKSDSLGGGASIIRNNAPNAGIWMGADMKSHPVGISVADFDNDGINEIAVALENRLLIVQLQQREYSEIASLDFPENAQIISIDSIDLDNNGQPEIYITALKDFRMESFTVEYINGKYQIGITNIPWFLRVIELPDGQKSLVGQQIDNGDKVFYGKPFQILRADKKLEKSQEISLPDNVNIYSFVPFKDDKNNLLYAYLTSNDYLKVITAQGTEVWESADYFGGSEIGIHKPKNYNSELNEVVYIRPRIDKTPEGEIIISQNDGLRTLQRYRMFKNSRLISLSWNGFSMVENWRTTDQQGYLPDFSYADADNDGAAELVMPIKFKHKSVLNDARSSVVIYELN